MIKAFLYISDQEFVVETNIDQIPKGVQTWERSDAIKVLVETNAADAVEDGLTEWKIVLDNIDNY